MSRFPRFLSMKASALEPKRPAMRRPLPVLLLTIGCIPFTIGCVDSVSERLGGQLVIVEVLSHADTCLPSRASGDGGLQFFGVLADGGVLLTVSSQVQYGPLRSGGALESTRLLRVPALDDGIPMGWESGCALTGTLTLTDGGFALEQTFPGVDECPSGPSWLPARRCTTSRELRLTPVGECRLDCVGLGASSEVSCDC